jgi:transcriptional regulator with XRE-family HTH domain
VEWKTIRAEYERAYRAAKLHGASQSSIALAGGLVGPDGRPKQNVISKILANDGLGPQVETFVHAVEGLGISVSRFFALVEQRTQHGADLADLEALSAQELADYARQRDEDRRHAFVLETLVGVLADVLEEPARKRLVRQLARRTRRKR